jgi:hypothetical protein
MSLTKEEARREQEVGEREPSRESDRVEHRTIFLKGTAKRSKNMRRGRVNVNPFVLRPSNIGPGGGQQLDPQVAANGKGEMEGQCRARSEGHNERRRPKNCICL